MLKVWTIVGFLSFSAPFPLLPGLTMLLLNLVILGTGTQSVTANRDTRRSDGSNKYEGVR